MTKTEYYDYSIGKVRLYKKAILILLVGYTMNLIMNYRFIFSLRGLIEVSLSSLIVGLSIWTGAEWITGIMIKKFPWLKFPVKRIIFSFIYIFLYSFTVAFLFNLIWRALFHKISWEIIRHDLILTLVFSMIIPVVMNVFIYAHIFFKNWKRAVINEEILKREQLALQFETLKNQVNPHFLFNSLNVLTSLVYKDPDIAANFIKQLSEVYRYVLDQKDKELVELADEIRFVERYLYLQKMRFDKHLQVDIKISEGKGGMIIPLSLQMLVENAIKHNEISEENPLRISIEMKDDYIVVRNNLQRKIVINGTSKIGLDNIKARYDYLTQKKFIIEETENEFIVKLPLLNITQ